VVLVLLWVLAFGTAAARAAARVGRATPAWFAFGAILGPVALLLLRAAPPALCRTCGSATRGWLKVCWWCRQSVFGAQTETKRPIRVGREQPAHQGSLHLVRARPGNPQRPLSRPLESPPDSLPVSAPPIRTGQGTRSTGVPLETLPRPAMPPPNGSFRGPTEPPPAYRAPADPRGVPADARGVPAATRAAVGQAGAPTHTLATAVYVAGSTDLQPGHRYAIAIRDSRLQILGPTELHPERVALDHPLAGLDVNLADGRLILADRNGFGLAFMAVAGPSTRDLAVAITDAAAKGVEP
jgi:hypothetical protein